MSLENGKTKLERTLITIRSSAKTETLRGGYSITELLPQNYTSGEKEQQLTAHGAQG
jgi:hypothetical protein